MLKAVSRRQGRINISVVPWDWEKEENGDYIRPMRRDPFKSIGASVRSLKSPHKVIGEPETSSH